MQNTGKRPCTAIVPAAAALAAVIVLLAGGCKNPAGPGKIAVTGVTLNKTAITLTVGASETLLATVQPEKAKKQTVTWTSGNEDAATVDKNGVVTAHAKGSAVITVTTKEGGFTAECTVTVTDSGGPGKTVNTVISDVAVTIAGPAKGEAPATTAATDDTGYTCGDVSWNPDDNPFLGGKVYTVTVTLTADEHYTFAENVTAFVNNYPAELAVHSAQSAKVSFTFAATNTKTVTGISIKTPPGNLTYTHGEALDLGGLVVTLAHDDNTSEDVALADFVSNNISENPAQGATLSHVAHNGKPVAVKFGELTANTNNLTVNQKSVTITGLSAADKTYDGTTEATVTGTAEIDGLAAGDHVTVSAGTAAFADKNAGTDKAVTFSGWGLAGADAGNYTLTGQPAGVTADIAQADPSVTWPTAAAITYGAALSTSALSGGVGAGVFAWTNGAIIPTVTNSGYQVTFTPTDVANYNTLTQNVNITVTPASITSAAVTVTAPAAGRLPNTIASGTGNFVGSVSWMPDDHTHGR